MLGERFEIFHVLLRLLAEGPGHQTAQQSHQQTAEPVLALLLPERRIRPDFCRTVARQTSHSRADNLAKWTTISVEISRKSAGSSGSFTGLRPLHRNCSRRSSQTPNSPPASFAVNEAATKQWWIRLKGRPTPGSTTLTLGSHDNQWALHVHRRTCGRKANPGRLIGPPRRTAGTAPGCSRFILHQREADVASANDCVTFAPTTVGSGTWASASTLRSRTRRRSLGSKVMTRCRSARGSGSIPCWYRCSQSSIRCLAAAAGHDGSTSCSTLDLR